jgi:hypothetical protein
MPARPREQHDVSRRAVARDCGGQASVADCGSVIAMSQPDRRDRYGTPNVAAKLLWSLVALAMIALGALWTFAGSGAATAFGPIVAGLGVALGYVVLIQKRR